MVALALLYGRVGLAELTDEVVGRAEVRELVAKVEIVLTADDDPDFPNGARADHVELEMDNGAVLVSDEVTRHRGHGQNPMTVDELRAKFDDCVAAKLPSGEARALFAALQSVDSLGGAAEIPGVAAAIG